MLSLDVKISMGAVFQRAALQEVPGDALFPSLIPLPLGDSELRICVLADAQQSWHQSSQDSEGFCVLCSTGGNGLQTLALTSQFLRGDIIIL